MLAKALVMANPPANASSVDNEVAKGETSKLNKLVVVGRQIANVCMACHSVEKNQPHKIGPNLWGLASRKIASARGFQYSVALTYKQGSWDYQQLDRFLHQPAAFAPGNRMPFPGIDDLSKRAAVIAWLATLNDDEVDWQIPINDLLPAKSVITTSKLLKPGKGSELVSMECASCHSLRLVIQQGMNRERWKETLDWMVDEQGMESLALDKKNVILDYLSTYYGE